MVENTAPPAITVLGAGAWGTALAIAIANNGHQVNLWSNSSQEISQMKQDGCNMAYLGEIPLPKNINLFDDLTKATADVLNILIVVPSHAFTDVIKKLKSLPQSQQLRIAWGSKGIDPNSHQLLHQACLEILSPKTELAVISGPSFAKEVALNKLTRLTIASRHNQFTQYLKNLLDSKTIYCETSYDIIGAQISGCVKNIYAILLGIADGLKLGDNCRAALITLCCQELQKIIVFYGGEKNSILNAAGIGDLVLTCCNDQSRNRQLGLAIGTGNDITAAQQKVGKLVEGYQNSAQIKFMLDREKTSFAAINTVYEILYMEADPKLKIQLLLNVDTLSSPKE